MVPPTDSRRDELTATIAHFVELHTTHSDAFLLAPGKTVAPAAASRHATGMAGEPRARPGLVLGETLGQGGMGLVRRAKQVALDRHVAVKTIQPTLATAWAECMLRQEGLILGRLEHPNILPIYDMQREADETRIVLKQIDGVEWSTLMHRPGAIRAIAQADALDWNLGILTQVCRAVHFAHSRGVVHRDLKPANVMLGNFGEVYVMDWGLAVCTDDDGSGRFPLARDATQLAGTPQYMAPEMLGGDGQACISPRTDVYLLGATLYEIIAGQPPHRGRDMREMIAQVVLSQPVLPASCPSELASICRKAMHPIPESRFESVETMRSALTGFLQHAGSRRLAEEAGRRADELIACLTDSEGLPCKAEHIHKLFGECRFAYRQALESWPENELAQLGQERALRAMIEHELAQHNPRSAANLLPALLAQDDALRARVAKAVAALEESEQRMATLEHFRRQLDAETGGRRRAVGASLLGIVWTIAPLATPWVLARFPEARLLMAIAFVVAVLFVLSVWAWFAHDDLAASSITRRMMRAAAVAMVGQLVLELTGAELHIDPQVIEVLWPLVWFCISAMIVMTVDWRLAPMTFGFLGALVVGAVWRDLRFYAMSASNLIMTINMFSVWMPRGGTARGSSAE